MNVPPAVRFTLEDAQSAFDQWGANCGPGAIAAICGLTLDELRPYLGDFERKRYTNPTLMWEVLRRLDVVWRMRYLTYRAVQNALSWPQHGLARVQWEGPWTAPGVPMRVRYRHTHWVACVSEIGLGPGEIFDINAMCAGGWIPFREWSEDLVPWLLQQCEPKANGKWHLTHVVEIARGSVDSISRRLQEQGSQIGVPATATGVEPLNKL